MGKPTDSLGFVDFFKEIPDHASLSSLRVCRCCESVVVASAAKQSSHPPEKFGEYHA